MRIKLVLAFLFFILGLIQLTDRICFIIRTESEKLSKPEQHAEYVAHFPRWLQAYFRDTIISTFGCALLFAVASVLFLTERKKLLLILGVVSFVLACWQLFSLT